MRPARVLLCTKPHGCRVSHSANGHSDGTAAGMYKDSESEMTNPTGATVDLSVNRA